MSSKVSSDINSKIITLPNAIPVQLRQAVLAQQLRQWVVDIAMEYKPSERDVDGGMTALSHKLTRIKDLPQRTWYSKIYDIRRGRYKFVSLDIADAILTAAHVPISTTNIHVFPTCKSAAIEMVETWYPDVDEEEFIELVNELLKVTIHMWNSDGEKSKGYIRVSPKTAQMVGGKSYRIKVRDGHSEHSA